MSSPSDGGGGSRLPLLAAIGGVLLVVAVGAFFVFGGGGDDDTAATETTAVETGEDGSTDGEDDVTTTTEVEDETTTTVEETTTTVAPPPQTAVDTVISNAIDPLFSTVVGTVDAEGTITLTGRPFDQAEADAVLEAANAIPGMINVVDQMKIQTDDERCTDIVQSQPNFACITDAQWDGSVITGTYYSSVDAGGPAFAVNGGLHLHVYASTFDPVTVGAPGPFSEGGGDWQVWDTPQTIEVSLAQLGVSEVPEKLCALIANQVHTIESFNSGTCWPITDLTAESDG